MLFSTYQWKSMECGQVLMLLIVCNFCRGSLVTEFHKLSDQRQPNGKKKLPQKTTGNSEQEQSLYQMVLDLQMRIEEIEKEQNKQSKEHKIRELGQRSKRDSTGQQLNRGEGTLQGDPKCPYNQPLNLAAGQCPFGPPGSPGIQGIPGRDGRDGRDGLPGPKADNIATDKDPLISSGSSISNQTGAVYVRWGRRECPLHSTLVYPGIAGGAHFTHSGSGANYLCLPDEPIYAESHPSEDIWRALVYGTEYETGSFPVYTGLQNNDVPCAVCKAPSRLIKLMVPARNTCPNDEWNLEYWGYLVADYHDHHRTEFVCLDKDAAPVTRSAHDTNGALFYPTEGRCAASGSGLPCGPYISGYELTCAVCTL